MEFHDYKKLVSEIEIGKCLPDSIYVHKSAISHVPPKLIEITLKLSDSFNIPDESWNIVKFYKRDFKITFLNYPGFEKESYPTLHSSYTIDILKNKVRKTDYSTSDNPPILHRKETFVAENYPLYDSFKVITREGEKVGLYLNTRNIGFRKSWNRLISNKGYYLDETGRLRPKCNGKTLKENPPQFIAEIERHKTAIDRNRLSAPMQILARHDYLNSEYTIFDFGCGKGDDLLELEAHGISCSGWDPVYRPDAPMSKSDIVNLGYVINVIEDRQERMEAILNAWKQANKLLVVSAMIAGETLISKYMPYKDGVITSRNTFQKYYNQSELRSYLETVLEENAVAVGQGIFFIFKDKLEEQEFLLKRQHISRNWRQLTVHEPKSTANQITQDLIKRRLPLFDHFWETCLDLGRIPANTEFEFSDEIRKIAGSHSKAHQALLEFYDKQIFEHSKQKRRQDLMVYFALGLFDRRKPQSKMPDSLKRDIKAFFNSYHDALDEAHATLFSVGRPDVIHNACLTAYAYLGCGIMEDNHSFTFHRKYLNDLPVELRIYIGCATQLYGDIENFDLIKAHITSGKVSLMRYDDWNKNVPMLLERAKIKLREQDIDFFYYTGEYKPQPLYDKDRFLMS